MEDEAAFSNRSKLTCGIVLIILYYKCLSVDDLKDSVGSCMGKSCVTESHNDVYC